MKTLKLETSVRIIKLIDNLKNSDMQKNILSFDLGLISYNRSYNLQEEIFKLIKLKDYPGVILLWSIIWLLP